MFKRIKNFFVKYKLLGFVIIASLIGGGLDLVGLDTASHWVLAITALIAVVPLIKDMFETVRTGGYGIDILAATAIIVAVVFREYWAAIIVVVMLTGGEALENYAEDRARGELTSLLNNEPSKASLLRGGKIISIAASKVAVGDKLQIAPGDVVPVDAVIIEGTSSFNESSLTGEPVPAPRGVGEQILSGSVNMDGAVTVKAVQTAANSQYAQIIKLVRSAAVNQAPFVRLADRYSIPFTIIAFGIAGAAWFISGESLRFLQVLVVATPCPLILGAPIALISGMSRASKQGIIIKNGTALERLSEIRTLAFDKTGTLTTGQPIVASVKTFNKFTRQQVLRNAAALEQSSNHILASAILAVAAKDKVSFPKAKQVKEISGRGLSGRLDGKNVLVGRLNLLEENGVALPKGFDAKTFTQTTTFVAVGGSLVGAISFTDELRKDAFDLIKRLKKAGIKKQIMVTGDNAAAAQEVGRLLGIKEVYADCLPVDKLRVIEQQTIRPVGFVGDGVNDAPVLTASEVGIALGARGSTAASESADVVIMLDDISRVATGIEIARRTMFIARQSILIGIFISIGLMLVFSTGRFAPVYGALLQELVDVAVILNALRAHGSFRKA